MIPGDLPPLLDKFGMNLADFYKKYLTAIIIRSPRYVHRILMMAPVKVNSDGVRYPQYLADKEYLHSEGHCIFLKDNRCAINDMKPYGGRFMECGKVTGHYPLFLGKSQSFPYWYDNQHLFDLIFPGFNSISAELKKIYDEIQPLYIEGKVRQIVFQIEAANELIKTKLFPLFNNSLPVGGFEVFSEVNQVSVVK
jgi:hypothetical protein